MAAIAFIESNTTGTGHLLANKARARGLEVAFLTANPQRHPWLVAEMFHPLIVDTQDPAAMLARLRGVDDLRAVLSSSEYYLEPAAVLAAALDLPGASPQAIAICRDKWRLQERLSDRGCPTPATTRVTSMAEAEACWQHHSDQVVVKPVAGSGSIGVRRHAGPSPTARDTFLDHVGALLAKTTNERGQPVQPVVLVQDFAAGDEVSVEMLSTAGGHRLLGITRKYLGEAPHCLEIAHDVPADLPEDLAQALEEAVAAALEAVGWTLGPTHTELKVDDGRPVLIEINPRLAGGMIPVLVEHATGVDVLEALLDLHLGKTPDLDPRRRAAASIGFLIAPRAGRLSRFEAPATATEGVVETVLKKRPGDAVVRGGDFRDRIGHVIATGAHPQESRRRMLDGLGKVALEVAGSAPAAAAGVRPPGGDTGRLRRTLHPEALAIVRKVPAPETRRRELAWLAAVDEAHLVMLADSGVLAADQVRPVLTEIDRLRGSRFAGLTESVAPRGTYLLYEGALVEGLGVDVAGVAHTGRSRNDINACLFRLRLRPSFEAVYRGLWRLRSSLAARAAQTLDVAMPVYSQFQPGLPGTFAYYLLSVEEALSRDQEAFRQLAPALDTSPLGACAGGGTPFPIDPRRTAELLGFSEVTRSALDAVASRDLALRLLAAAAISGVHISRLAQDLQLWTTQEFGFLTLPDELAGGSSMMPQKKNPYLLEMIKGRASRLGGQWSAAAGAMTKTPFSNAVEVGTEAMAGVAEALRSFEEAAVLTALHVAAATPNPQRMEQSARDGVVSASLVTDTLVAEQGLAFRSAHHAVGAAIRGALEAGDNPQAAVHGLLGDADLGQEPLDWARRYEHGGGPGRESTRAALAAAEERLGGDARWLDRAVGRWRQADETRARAVADLLGGESSC